MYQKNSTDKDKLLASVRKKIYKQALMAVFLILLTVVLLFAITTAWYTNIVHTSGLVFEAAAWGFEGDIQTSDTPITAGPGDNGNIQLTLTNESSDVVEATVNVSKITMDSEMQKRLFFYVEDRATRNGEVMDRVYVNSLEGYTYMVFGMNELKLTDSIHNDAQLKWQWVYDVLGYYVAGTKNEDGTIAVEEYLRPIEYHYDEAKTTFAADEGSDSPALKLETIDGEMTVQAFLEQISSVDGYKGKIDINARTPEGYYPVEVDKDGYGVWAYLCDRTEIALATNWDTQLGAKAAQAQKDETIQLDSYVAKLSISGQKSDISAINVSTQTGLANALGSTNDVVLQLTQNISMEQAAIPTGKKVVLDLNGYTLSSAADTALMNLQEGSSVTVMNGELVVPENMPAFTTQGGELTLSNVTGKDIKRLVSVQDLYGTGVDSKIRVLDSNVEVKECAIHLLGNGLASEQKTQVIVENSTLVSDYACIMGNGDVTGNGSWGTDTVVINSTLKGGWASIYMPQQNSTMTVVDSVLEGYTGIVLKGGHTKIINTKVTGTGAATDPEYVGGGWKDTGDGVLVEANYDWETLVEISGTSVVESKYNVAVRKYMEDAPQASVIIYSGQFSSDVSRYKAESSTASADGRIITAQ